MGTLVKNVIGLMSGTSLDGLDIAHCIFKKNGSNYNYELCECNTIEYSPKLYKQLSNAINLSEKELRQLDKDLGTFIGLSTKSFIKNNHLEIDLICSHGHTVFHQPENGITRQIGDGLAINEITKIPVVNNFRSLDVSLGGQGAPLVPIGDKLLFPEFENCINLGGIANVSMDKDQVRVAWDICPMNLALNHLSEKLGYKYDKDGEIARTGVILPELLNKLNNLDYYRIQPPKSLGLEWVQQNIYPLTDSNENIPDIMRTVVEHICLQIERSISNGKVLMTGGGTHNKFLIELLGSKINLVIPEKKVVDFKEALIFGFLGYLKINNEINVLKSVTGAKKDSISGVLIDNFSE